MISSFAQFFSEYEEFDRIVSEYSTSYQYGLSQSAAAQQSADGAILQQIQSLETQDRERKLAIQHQVQVQISQLRNILLAVDDMEHSMDEPRYHRFKQNNWHRNSRAPGHRRHTRDDINTQVDETIKAIKRITNSKMPKSLAAICSFFNPVFRHDSYRKIAEQRDQLEQMIVAAENDIHAQSAQTQREITQATLAQLNQIQAVKNRADAERSANNTRYFTQLKKLLLDGLERTFCGQNIYSNAHSEFSAFSTRYLAAQTETTLPSAMLAGLATQMVDVADDGTLDHFLKSILKDGMYADKSILLPITLQKYFTRPICVTYQADQNSSVFPLFMNYATQLLDLYRDEGVALYFVDCTNLGANCAEFTSVSGQDEDKRINVIRTPEALKEALDTMSDYIIESNTQYLKNEYRSIEEYNQDANMKREVRLLFICNLSEVKSSELENKLLSILRNGSRCGVHSFVAISSEEYQVSNTIMQSRVTTVSSMIDLCDRIFMGTNGSLSFGNGLPEIIAPPQIQSDIVQSILNKTVKSKQAMAIIPFEEHAIPFDRYFTETCFDAIRIPIGLTPQGDEYCITLNKDAAYMLVGGNPSCGKSSLIHTIVLQCLTRYAPENLELYLADLKDGSEFDVYAQRGVKAVKAVLDDSEPDIAASYLRFIESTVNIRIKTFEKLTHLSGQIVKNIEQFYAVNNQGHYLPNMPRILLIVDEFQSLYNSSRETGEITNWLVRMCRTVGIFIIMASQRAQGDATAVANSFGSQTKEYFVYRGIMKLPYSGAREIMSEHCSDTNRENTAIRKAQLLKTGQIIINSNMGATEEENQLVQCYYPSSAVISTICEKLIDCQGQQKGIILNSESETAFDRNAIDSIPGITFGESNHLYHDICHENADPFRDSYYVSLDHTAVNRLLVLGNDKRVPASVVLSIARKLIQEHQGNFIINFLGGETDYENLIGQRLQNISAQRTDDITTFLQQIEDATNADCYILNVLVRPHEHEQLRYEAFSDPSEEVNKLRMLWNQNTTFTVVIEDGYSSIKNDCTYCDADIPCRVISVGNLAGIQSAMTLNAAEKVSDSPFNTIRPNVIKAYYYNKQSDKCGRLRLFNPNDISIETLSTSPHYPGFDTNYAGLTGN